jgi:hypothetical protein
MGRIVQNCYSVEYLLLQSEAAKLGEYNDCAIKAISIVTGIGYHEAKRLCELHGRTKAGVLTSIIIEIIRSLGFEIVEVNIKNIIKSYPGNAKLLKNVTTHHMDRYPDEWRDGKTYLMFTRGHVLAVVNGVNHDRSRGKAIRAYRIVEIIKKEQ